MTTLPLYENYIKKAKWTTKDLEIVKSLLEEASESYYNSNEKTLSDEQFDLLKDKYETFKDNPAYDELQIGAEPPVNKGTVDVDHSFGHLVGSLGKVNTINELDIWFRDKFKAMGYTKDSKFSVIVSFKYDGNSVVIELKEGRIIKVLTRGRNGKGMDLTHAFNKDKYTIDTQEHVGVRYEVVITYENFQRVIDETGVAYANPRSMVAGKLGDDNVADFSDYFTLVPLGMSYKDKETTKEEELEFIKNNFESGKNKPKDLIYNDISYNKNAYVFEETVGNIGKVIKTIKGIYDELSETRGDLDFMIDGLVVELMDEDFKKLGTVNNKPKWAVALKFPYMEKKSKVTHIEFDLGKTGRLTPMCCFEPVVFNGATQKRVSLGNYARFKNLGLGKGSSVLVQYRNDTLSYVEKLKTQPEGIEPIPFTSECPVCGGQVYINEKETFAFCGNEDCKNKVIGRIERYIEKLDIKGVKKSTIEKLYDLDLIKTIGDMYRLTPEVMVAKGIGEKTANNIVATMESKIPYDYEVIAGIGIEDFGLTNSKVLLTNMDINTIFDYNEETGKFFYETDEFYNTVTEMEGFSHIKTSKLMNGLSESHNEFSDLIDVLMSVKEWEIPEIKVDLEKNKSDVTYTFVVTGSITKWKNRKELSKELEMMGHTVAGGVTSKTDYLVNNDSESTSSKNKKAIELGKPIITEEQLLELLGME